MNTRLLWLLAGLLAGCPSAEAPRPATTMKDVSLVWPLPEGDAPFQDQGYLLAGSLSGEGVLLPKGVFERIPALTRTEEPEALYTHLTVVGARLDPCFHEGPGEERCQPNVRLVLQPIVEGAQGWEARDASLHVFYAARDEAEVITAIEGLARARFEVGDDGSGPLGVHPMLGSDEGRAQVKALLLPLLESDRLSRVTSISVHGDDAAWTFSGFDWRDGEAVSIVIPETGGASSQHFLSLHADRLEGSTEPPGASRDDFSALMNAASASELSPEALQAGFDAAARIENPVLHNPGTVDCVSCHVAPVARVAAARVRALATSPDTFTSARHDLTPTSNFTNPRAVRAFGYRYRELFLSPRVIHESAAVADRVEDSLRTE